MTVESLTQRAHRFEYLDMLRLLCAVSVVIFHYVVIAPYTGVLPARYFAAPHIAVYGQFGVHIFFIISGFVITLSARGRGAGAFLWARFLRLYPAYWICCSITAVTILLIGTGNPTLWVPSWHGFLVNLTMLQSYVGVANVDEVYWSLAIELRFYAIVAVLILLRLRVDALWLIVLWLLACIVAPYAPSLVGKAAMAVWAPCFIIGILAQRMITRSKPWLEVGLMLVAMALAARSIFDQHLIQASRQFYPYDPRIAAAIVAAGALLVVGCAYARAPGRFAGAMMAAGAMTYPLYLLHAEVGTLIAARLDGAASPAIVLIGVACAVLAAVSLIALVIEPRFRRALRAFGQELTRKIATATNAGGTAVPVDPSRSHS